MDATDLDRPLPITDDLLPHCGLPMADDAAEDQFYDKVPKQFLYTRHQAAAALAMSVARLDELIRARKIRGVKDGRRVKFTPADLQAYVDSLPPLGGIPGEPERYPGGLTRRSWLYRQRYGLEGNPNLRGPKRKQQIGTNAVLSPKVKPAPSWYHKVCAERPEVIAGMPDLTGTQLAFLNRLREETQIVVDGRSRRSIEALVRRGLATYEAEHVLNENTSTYIYRFTVCLAEEVTSLGAD